MTPTPRSVLIVDDDFALRRVMEAGLRSIGFNVFGTGEPDEAMTLLRTEHFDLVITDLLMPEFEGTEFIKTVKNHQPDAIVIALSGGDANISAELCLEIANENGAGVPLTKPFKLEKLLWAAERACSNRTSVNWETQPAVTEGRFA